MINEWGMSTKLGPIALSGGQQGQASEQWGQEINQIATDEVRRLVNNAYVTAKKVLTNNKKLFEQETVSAEEFQLLIAEYGEFMTPYEVYGESYGDDVLPFKDFAVAGRPSPAEIE